MKYLYPLSFFIFCVPVVFAQTNFITIVHLENPTTITAAKPKVLYGIASFYADKFNGRTTANGAIYNHAKLTAACNVLPLNTWIRVTNLRNSKAVIVQINDRLHPKNKRIVDMSKSAATLLGYIGRGLTQVKVEVLTTKKVKK